MQNIQQRQRALLEIIGQYNIYSQEELQDKLQAQGIQTTQATLSRDLKALHIVKVPGEGYKLPQTRPMIGSSPQGILSIEFSGPIAVIKTHPGFASAVASFIDHHPCRPVMGTLAGDDTVLLVLRAGYTIQDTLDALKKCLPEISSHLVNQ